MKGGSYSPDDLDKSTLAVVDETLQHQCNGEAIRPVHQALVRGTSLLALKWRQQTIVVHKQGVLRATALQKELTCDIQQTTLRHLIMLMVGSSIKCTNIAERISTGMELMGAMSALYNVTLRFLSSRFKERS